MAEAQTPRRVRIRALGQRLTVIVIGIEAAADDTAPIEHARAIDVNQASIRPPLADFGGVG